MIEVTRVLAKKDVFGFGLSEPEEAYLLRKEGINHPILLLSGFEKDWLEDMFRLNITPVITNKESLKYLIEFIEKSSQKLLKDPKKVSVHLKVDTGMRRFGIDLSDLEELLEIIRNYSFIEVSGVMTHLACSEKPDSEVTKLQLSNFREVMEKIKKFGINPSYVHFANSGGILYLKERGNLVRPGIALYGGYPDLSARDRVKLYPVMTLKSRIVEIKRLKKGEIAGYGPTFKAEKDTLLGIVPIGYADGYLRSLSNKGFAFCRNRRVRVVGTVSMKALYVDLTGVEEVEKGDEVILLGGPENEVPADELALLAGTISYEIFCSFGRAIPKTCKRYII